jgi:hypothetical protein
MIAIIAATNLSPMQYIFSMLPDACSFDYDVGVMVPAPFANAETSLSAGGC